MKIDIANLKYTPRQIKNKTRKISHKILAESENLDNRNFNSIAIRDVSRLFELYDQYFFDRFFQDHHRQKIFFGLSDRMTRSGGRIVYAQRTGTYTISLSTTLIFQTFHDVTRDVAVNGIVCHNRLEATMRILEHEIIHLLEYVRFGSSSCSKPRFQDLSYNIFGHTEVTHQLVTQTERAQKKFNLQAGDKVSFEYNGMTHHGFISSITKRATVMANDPDGDYKDFQGNRYCKYYIPLSSLEAVK
ncbi:MAG: hypothetical protein E4G94_11940 [ANME-2 cluster archaeon]|nr:MAG: hypothetical protein E4G94_11940 [ANME-2 cluster archaeon]